MSSIVKMLRVISLLVLLVHIVVSVSLIEKYKDSCDKIDIDSLLKNTAIVNAYVNCLANRAPCTKYGKEIKSTIPEIMSTACANCSTNQKRIVRRVMNFMYKNKRSDFDTLFDLYDPQKTYRESMMDFMAQVDRPSDLQTPSNSTPHKLAHLPRRSPKPTPSTTPKVSSTESSEVTRHKLHSRSPRYSSTPLPTSANPTTDHHKFHKMHPLKLPQNSTLTAMSE